MEKPEIIPITDQMRETGPELNMSSSENGLQIPALKWNDISMEVVAEMKDIHDKTNIHYQEELDEQVTEVNHSNGETVQEAFAKMERDGLIPNDSAIQVLSKRFNETPEPREKKITKEMLEKRENFKDISVDNNMHDDGEEKVTKKAIDFSILQKRKDMNRKENVTTPPRINNSTDQVLQEVLVLLKDLKATVPIVVNHNHYYAK